MLKLLTTILKTIGTFVIFATKSSSITMSFKGVGSLVLQISSGVSSILTISIKVIFEIVLKK